MSGTAGEGERRFYVVGGEQRKGAMHLEEWHGFRRGLICEIAVDEGSCREVTGWISPRDVVADDPETAILFKAATRVGDRLYTCTQTEVLIFRLPDFKQVGYLSLPSFNDVHHVRPTSRGTLLVVCTGLDLVQEIEPLAHGEGRVVREWSVLDEAPWHRFDRAVDYRRVLTTKPHGSHPNYLFEADGELWVTRFEQKDARCLSAPGRRIDIGIERPHDGVVDGRRVYFTTVDGQVVIASLDQDRVERVVDLNRIVGSGLALGWCRGLHLLSPDKVVVGFSRLRPTKTWRNLRWLKHRVGLRATPGNLPSRIACFDLSTETLCWEFNVEEHGMNALFSIHPVLERDQNPK